MSMTEQEQQELLKKAIKLEGERDALLEVVKLILNADQAHVVDVEQDLKPDH